jgi:hypothetical protein
MARVRHQPFDRVHEIDAAVAPRLPALHEKPFQKLPASRASSFIA